LAPLCLGSNDGWATKELSLKFYIKNDGTINPKEHAINVVIE